MLYQHRVSLRCLYIVHSSNGSVGYTGMSDWHLRCSSFRRRRFSSRMLKITTKERPGSVTFVLEGRLCGPWAAEAEVAWARLVTDTHDQEILLDLAGVTFIDHVGEALLASMLGRGTKVRASGVMISHLVQEVQQKVSRG